MTKDAIKRAIFDLSTQNRRLLKKVISNAQKKSELQKRLNGR